ncbi:type III pantothenate kinase [Congregibacter brevis]|uniref:Type III pantothenate kinase n=1 Tax=Congregibacter brevis TaxID=3081201 RepID=A0ABZ0ICJ0_9GAMM|nr:type III pantothenate kinase [Congregibacter sp. IMCC45268]
MTRALLLDIGNSATKWMAFDSHAKVSEGRVETAKIVDALMPQLEDTTVLVSSVAAPDLQNSLSASLAPLCKRVWFAQSRGAVNDLVNSYADPERMGVDRWLAMLGARRRVAGRICVVDAGSALTIDLVAEDGRHEGGYIIPGVALMKRALFADTDRVRDSLSDSVSIAPGCSTAEAVSHGLLLAQAGAVSLSLSHATAGGEAPEVLMCGGGADDLAQVLDVEVTIAPRLVLEGLLLQAQIECADLLDYPSLWQAYHAVPA